MNRSGKERVWPHAQQTGSAGRRAAPRLWHPAEAWRASRRQPGRAGFPGAKVCVEAWGRTSLCVWGLRGHPLGLLVLSDRAALGVMWPGELRAGHSRPCGLGWGFQFCKPVGSSSRIFSRRMVSFNLQRSPWLLSGARIGGQQEWRWEGIPWWSSG